MHIQPLTQRDSEAYYQLRLEALEVEPNAFGQSVAEHRAMPLQAIAERLAADANNFVLGAFDGEHLVGMAGFVRSQEEKARHKGSIRGVYVTAARRGQGIGRMLLSELLRRVQRQPDLEQITLTVATTQTAATRLYVSLGFQVYGRETRALKIGDNYVDEDLMVLRFDRLG